MSENRLEISAANAIMLNSLRVYYADWPKYPILNTTFDDLLGKVPE